MNTARSGSTRRAFFRKLGAGASAVLASTAGLARADSRAGDDTAPRAALLEQEQVLRGLHQAFERAMDSGQHEALIGMFADDGEVLFHGVTFTKPEQGVHRLFLGYFRANKTGRRMEAAPGFEPPADQQQHRLELASDLLSATAAFPYSIQVGMPIESGNSLASMARLQGEGVRTWWEGGLYIASYVRIVADGSWKIRRLEYRTLSRADYRPGRSWASAMPDSPLAADRLEAMSRREAPV